ncbi:MAG: DEAD/DEAH box helicase, partial [Patescibacteria group bacterium]
KARRINPWWRDNAIFIECGQHIKPSEFVRALSDFAYQRASRASGRGIFALRGGLIEVWPINCDTPFLIEFRGNTIDAIHRADRPERTPDAARRPAASIERMTPGGFVVHEDHGIGIFRGITETSADVEPQQYYIVEYAPPKAGRPPDVLYVPVEQKKRLTPYCGFTTPHIHRLGGGLWERTKRRVKEDAEKTARELLALYAARHGAARSPIAGDNAMLAELRASFQFQDTPDQRRAEEMILTDFGKNAPMDRILCGDVGFGKTEIAIRAAFYAITAGFQVALIAPTTILAAQHEATFRERLGRFPVRIAMLSRLTVPADSARIKKELASGTLDCVIGTHRILSRDIVFKNPVLLVIDEEQRFGVRQKEHFKKMRPELDILTLSATPIPRTIQFALAHLRDISLIETPPPERIPIVTTVLPWSRPLIRNAIAHELNRGGQVYFLHNRIETLEKTRRMLKELIAARTASGQTIEIGILHGRMNEQAIIKAMDAFREKRTHILLATTIIENGLDISSANTLIVDDATRLGLAQAHQLRGRIGRGRTQAFAYFLYPARHRAPEPDEAPEDKLRAPHKKNRRRITDKAALRLEAIQDYADLGAGYQIALRDLEIRGAGNILGREQSGAVNKVGLNLYCQMLADAVETLNTEKA